MSKHNIFNKKVYIKPDIFILGFFNNIVEKKRMYIKLTNLN